VVPRHGFPSPQVTAVTSGRTGLKDRQNDTVSLTPAVILPILLERTGKPQARQGDRVQDEAP
jgi:hypothetical protein